MKEMTTTWRHNVTFREAARQFEVAEREIQDLLQRGALEGFFRNGQWWVRLGPREGEDPLARLWHGTTNDRAVVIFEQGFWPETARKQVWFTTSEMSARLHGIGRAQQRRGRPVLLGCTVDLRKYPLFWRRSAQIYVFHQPLGAEVITSVQELDEREQSRHYRMERRKQPRSDLVPVGITKASGTLGILLWINTFLEVWGGSPVTEEHPVVREVVAWVAQEYRDGRDNPITDEELAMRVASLLPSG